MIVSIGISSCKKEVNPILSNSQTEQDSGKGDDDNFMLKSSFVEEPVSPQFGKPNVTDFVFQVYDPSGTQPMSVKFFERATGAVNYVAMSRVGSYWKLTKKMLNNGWFDYRYVYTTTNTNISSISREMCATYNTFNINGVSSIYWPFGSDGSSWNNKTCYVNGIQQQWLRGNSGGGYDVNEGTHTGYSEQYAVDWNRRKITNWSTSDDLGAELKSPFDGEILNFGTYSTSCCGLSKFVSVVQKGPDNKIYKFFFGHLQSYPSYFIKKTPTQSGTPVKAGWTTLGWLGSSGATSPHAHCSMRDNGTEQSLEFEFNAQ